MLSQVKQSQRGIYYLRYYPDPILNQATKWVMEMEKAVKMAQTMKEFLSPDAIGLAANQVGIQRRFFVWQIKEKEPQIAMNPVIKEWSQKSHISEEGCLSFPTNTFKIMRSDEVLVTYWNEAHEMQVEWMKGIHSDLFQHEIDHLDGITAINNINLVEMN